MTVQPTSFVPPAWLTRRQPGPTPQAPQAVPIGMTLLDRVRLAPANRGTVPAVAPAGTIRPWSRPGAAANVPVSATQHVVAPEASRALGQAVGRFDGMAWAGHLSSNGNRDVAVLIPRGVDLSRPVEVITFFHGNGGSAAASVKGMRPLIEQLPAHGRNAIYVVPSSSGRGSDPSWMNPRNGESLIQLQNQAVAEAQRLAGRPLQVGSYSVAGFSGGGKPLATAARAGELRASHVNLFDASYGDWAEAIVRHRAPGTTVNSFYTEHNRERSQRLSGQAGVHIEAATGSAHGQVPGRYFYR